jgi:hypothetical protein
MYCHSNYFFQTHKVANPRLQTMGSSILAPANIYNTAPSHFPDRAMSTSPQTDDDDLSDSGSELSSVEEGDGMMSMDTLDSSLPKKAAVFVGVVINPLLLRCHTHRRKLGLCTTRECGFTPKWSWRRMKKFIQKTLDAFTKFSKSFAKPNLSTQKIQIPIRLRPLSNYVGYQRSLPSLLRFVWCTAKHITNSWKQLQGEATKIL